MNRSFHCLICNTALEWKPIILTGTEENVTETLTRQCVKFQSGLQLLCTQLNINENNVSKLFTPVFVERVIGSNNTTDCAGVTNGIPCCPKCYSACEEMLRLQHAIKEIQASLMKEVNTLTDSLVSSISDRDKNPPEYLTDLDLLDQIRWELVKSAEIHKLSSKEYQPCHVLLKRIPVSQLKTLLEPKENISTVSTCINNTNTDLPSISSPRKSKLKACISIRTNLALNEDDDQSSNNDMDDDNEVFVPSPEPMSEPDNDNESCSSEEDQLLEVNQIKEETSPLKVTKVVSLNSRKPRKTQSIRQSRFYLINEHTLLCKYTLIKVTHGATQFTCQESGCLKTYKDPNWYNLFEKMRNHIEASHRLPRGKPKTCPLCPNPETIFTDGQLFRQHLVSPETHSIKTFICESCWKPLSGRVDFYHQHAISHKPGVQRSTTKLKCRHCGKLCISVNLSRHEATHLPKDKRKQYLCSECPKVFLCSTSLQEHIEKVHQKEQMKVRTCPVCSRQFYWKHHYAFTAHLRKHKNEKPFVCETCGKGYSNAAEMRKHQRRAHNIDKTIFKCEQCEKSYTFRPYLNRHIERVHKDKSVFGPEVKYPCTKCDKAFSRRSALNKHLKNICKDDVK